MIKNNRNPWSWIPTLFYGMGIPYVAVMTVSVIMYKRFGLSNSEIAFYTSWLYLPWVLKPIWSPIVDILRTKRSWIVLMQLLVGASLGGVALAIPAAGFVKYTLAFFWLLAFSSATHDIAAEGFYMIGLNSNEQAYFIGIRNTFYRISVITCQGLLIILVGHLEKTTGNITFAWSITFLVLSGLFFLLFLYHMLFLPKPANDIPIARSNKLFNEFAKTFSLYFKKKNILAALAFILLYRLGEAQLVKMAAPFLLDARAKGGLGLNTEQFGLIYGTIGIIFLTVGGLLGGITVSKFGLKKCLFPMFLAINLPHAAYIYLSAVKPESLWLVNLCVSIEQLGYGFGFTALQLYMIYFANSDRKTSHYAITTGFQALGMMIPGMFSGWIQEQIGYFYFFLWILLTILPGFIVLRYIKVEDDFGKTVNG